MEDQLKKEQVQSVLHMKGGTDDGSYHHFSETLQSTLNRFYWPALADSIASHLPLSSLLPSIAIADLGCSCAFSTIAYVNHTVHSLRLLYSSLSLPQPSIQAFFNDLPSNDFNTLLRNLSSLPPCPGDLDPLPLDHPFRPPVLDFFPAAVPGSFYSRIFPPAALHVATCTLALHNLSQVPPAVEDVGSAAWNEGRIWMLEGCKTETLREYEEQYQRDLVEFLRCREEELVPGGLLFCVMFASKENKRRAAGLYRQLETAWKQLISEGALAKDTIDGFNLHIYMPTVEDVQRAVATSGAFTVFKCEIVEVERAPEAVWHAVAADSEAWGKTTATMVRNFVGSRVVSHLGEANFELLMERLEQVAAADEEDRSRFLTMMVLILSRTQA